jgi:alpha-ketoglutarate-dependent taurine dioxygenase/DUF971 family protein
MSSTQTNNSGIANIKKSNSYIGNSAPVPNSTTESMLRITKTSYNDKILTLSWGDSFSSDYHFIWLRHNCFCQHCGNSIDGIRSITILDISADIKPREVQLNENRMLKLTWDDGHQSLYDASWLRAHCYDDKSRSERLRFQPITWKASMVDNFPSVDYSSALHSDSVRLDMFEKLRDYGIVKVDDVGSATEETEKLANLIGPIHETTVYGYIYDVQVEAVSKLGAKTAIHQDPHHDDAFYYNHPGIDVFHCLINDTGKGGESTYCDGFAIAESIREEAPKAFELLTTVPIQHNRCHPGEIDLRIHAPLIRLDWNGKLSGVRYFDRAMAPLDMPSDLVAQMFEAIRHYHKRMVSSEFKITIKVPPGAGMLIDNQRVMHGRTAFRTDSGRHIRLCHVPRDEFHGRLRDLGARLGRDDYDIVLPQGACPS